MKTKQYLMTALTAMALWSCGKDEVLLPPVDATPPPKETVPPGETPPPGETTPPTGTPENKAPETFLLV
ncbi:MAG: hypothetical protein WBM83_10185, partial [Flavobacteriaceae bacterium]